MYRHIWKFGLRLLSSIVTICALFWLLTSFGLDQYRDTVKWYHSIGHQCFMQADKPNDELYFFQHGMHLTCAEMHHGYLDKDFPDSYGVAVYLPGNETYEFFSKDADAIAWVKNQPLVVNPKQVR